MSGANLPDLPIKAVLPELLDSLEVNSNAVLVAPPGAGKTTVVPLALLVAEWRDGQRIIVLEPRRIAARAAASRMAALLGESVGKTIGYRVRFDTKISRDTIIEVVTEGVFIRMLAEDPGLESVAAVLFDEFHERSLNSDLGLALCLDLQSALRPDLRLIAMSATLDGASVASLMDAPVVESEGKAFPVDIHYRERSPSTRVEAAAADAVREIMSESNSGSCLVFLPGQGEIERTATLLDGRLPDDVVLHRLYGALNRAQQDAAIEPDKSGKRKVVLSSAIAETSLTIEGIDCVVDSGLSRQPVFEPSTGLVRLETVRSSQASIVQRAGRAGRLGPGIAIRLWREQQTAALPPHTPPEILNADLSSLILDLGDWGVSDPLDLQWLNPPPASAIAEAQNLLQRLGAMDDAFKLTPHGRSLRTIPLPPRLAHMVASAARFGKSNGIKAGFLALLIQERGVGGPGTDLESRLAKAERQGGTAAKLRATAKNMIANVPTAHSTETLSAGVLLAHAFPDRIAQARGQTGDKSGGGRTRFLLANGRGAEMEADEMLARSEFIVVVDMTGRAGAARILSAAEISKSELLEYFPQLVEEFIDAEFKVETGKFTATKVQKLGAIALTKPEPVDVGDDEALTALLTAVRTHGLDILPWQESDISLRNRLVFLHTNKTDDWPAVDDAALLSRLDHWLAPFLAGQRGFDQLPRGSLGNGLLQFARCHSLAAIEALAPSHFDVPSGSRIPIRYLEEGPRLSVRPQELFGLDNHPALLNGAVPIDIELLSPAQRPIQITRDLPGFWRGTWADMRKDMRGRYPKHPWPEDPLSEAPTRRVKPRPGK